jgi:capsid portal protein
MQIDANGDTFTRLVPRYFRRYAQISPGTLERVYFKEFGDPRIIDPKTGEVAPDLPFEEQATEIYMDAQYIPGHLYGVPKWIGILPAILGSREAEEVNLNFFRENAIPAMAVLVSLLLGWFAGFVFNRLLFLKRSNAF